MKHLLLFAVVGIVVCLSLAAALLYAAATDAPLDQYPADKACYALFDRNGVEWKSWYPPVPAADGGGAIFTFNNDHTWGYVFGPSTMVADRDCLHERGVDVPPLEDRSDP